MVPGCQVPGVAVGVSAGLLLSALAVCISELISLSLLATVRGARHFFVQSDKETKQRKRFNRSTLSVHSVQFQFMGVPKARCSLEPWMFEPLFLANPDMNTLRHQGSRASTSTPRSARPHAFLGPCFSVGWRRGSTCVQIRWKVVRG